MLLVHEAPRPVRFQVWRKIVGYADYFVWDSFTDRAYQFEYLNSQKYSQVMKVHTVLTFVVPALYQYIGHSETTDTLVYDYPEFAWAMKDQLKRGKRFKSL